MSNFFFSGRNFSWGVGYEDGEVCEDGDADDDGDVWLDGCVLFVVGWMFDPQCSRWNLSIRGQFAAESRTFIL